MSDEHQDWPHCSLIVSSWWFTPSPSPNPSVESFDGGDGESDDASSFTSDDEMTFSQ